MPPVQPVLQRQRSPLDTEQNDVIIIAWAYNVTCKKKNKKRTDRQLVHNILKKRKGQGAYQHLVRELQGDGERFYGNFAAWHRGCLSCRQNSRENPTGDVILGIFPSEFAFACRTDRYMERFIFSHRIPHAAANQETDVRIHAPMNIIRPIFLLHRIPHAACRYSLTLLSWNCCKQSDFHSLHLRPCVAGSCSMWAKVLLPSFRPIYHHGGGQSVFVLFGTR